MKVVHVSYSVGEASANTRLHYALLAKGIDSKILTLEGDDSLKEVYKIKMNPLWRKISQKRNWLAKILFDIFFIKRGMPYHMGLWGKHIEKEKIIIEADIIHLHWICDFVSPKTIKKLASLGKTIIWTCHDSWPITGGCNVKYDCTGFYKKCDNCMIMKHSIGNVISRHVWKQKKKYLKNCPIYFIAPSNWMADNIIRSSLFGKNKIYVVPNTLDLSVYNIIQPTEIEERLNYTKDESKIHILFGATSIHIPYKGFSYLLQMLKLLYEERQDLASKIVIHFLGEGISKEEILDKYECRFWGYVSDERKKACIYNLADVLVYPSLEDSLSYVVMESLACATPAVIFNTGGIPDQVEHKKNGYIAEYKNYKDLLNGLIWCIENNKENIFGKYGEKKIRAMFSYDIVAEKTIQIYRECIT